SARSFFKSRSTTAAGSVSSASPATPIAVNGRPAANNAPADGNGGGGRDSAAATGCGVHARVEGDRPDSVTSGLTLSSTNAAESTQSTSVPASAKAKAKGDAQPQWKNDALGPGCPSSHTIVLNWLNESSNYERWKGSEGDTQTALASDIQQEIIQNKCRAERSVATIVEKIKAMEKAFRAANDWRLQTGQGILDDAAAQDDSLEDDEDENKLTRRMNLVKSSVEAEVMKKCDFYYDVLGVMGERVSSNPSSSYSTTAKTDRAGAALRRSVLTNPSDEEDEDESNGEDKKEKEERRRNEGAGEKEGEKVEEDGNKEKGGEGQSKGKGKEKETPVKKEGVKGRPSETGRKFDKVDKASTPKRKPSAIEAALELRSQDRTKMEAELNTAKVKAEKLGAIMAVARQLREADEDLSFSDAMKQAKEIYEDV
ncbi:hypothetical protein CF336_g8032, partial [Tilletia laevis]